MIAQVVCSECAEAMSDNQLIYQNGQWQCPFCSSDTFRIAEVQ